jgi:tetratricopeptide (TPR) repeat protein
MPRSDLHGCASTSKLICAALMVGVALGQAGIPQTEQNAYEVAVHRKEVQAKIKGLEFFLKTFPSSALKEPALESLADAYSQSGNLREEQETLERLLRDNADNLRGLTLKAYVMLLGCDSGDCEQQQASLADHGFRVLGSATKPDYLSDAEFGRQKAEAEFLFHRLAGVAALMQHDYETAQTHCLVLVEADPNNFGYVYMLALAYLNASPLDMSKGLFFMARAAALSPASGRKKIEDYGREQYEKYHGSAQGWSEVLRLAKASPQLPSGFAITPAR